MTKAADCAGLPCPCRLVTLRTFDSVDQVASPRMVVTDVLSASIAPVRFFNWDLVCTRHTLDFVGHCPTPLLFQEVRLVLGYHDGIEPRPPHRGQVFPSLDPFPWQSGHVFSRSGPRSGPRSKRDMAMSSFGTVCFCSFDCSGNRCRAGFRPLHFRFAKK